MEIHYQKKNINRDYRCKEPITSFGIVNINIKDSNYEITMLKNKFSYCKNSFFKITSKKYPAIKCYLSDNICTINEYNYNYKINVNVLNCNCAMDIAKFSYYKNKITFMMVSRKYSLGFIEFIRGKYHVSDSNLITNLFRQMYKNEILMIRKYSYDDILYIFLNRNNEDRNTVLNKIYEGKYSDEYCDAKTKFNMLKYSNEHSDTDIPFNLKWYVDNIKPQWNKPEWGFPKGRREKKYEENLMCACREFEEETGYKKNEYCVLNKIEPIDERMKGTNGIVYKHVYYLAINNREQSEINDYDTHEIGDVKWFTYEEAILNIRPYHQEKKKILTQIYLFILNFLIKNI